MPRVGFEPTFPAFERATVMADWTATNLENRIALEFMYEYFVWQSVRIRITREEEICWNREHPTPKTKKKKNIWIETEHDGIYI
jgi:hypothetical protein